MSRPALAFVDLETTGAAARDGGITEIGIVRVDDAGELCEWATLVNPGRSIPAEIQALTGITNDMVARAPRFDAIADEVASRLSSEITRIDFEETAGELGHCCARHGSSRRSFRPTTRDCGDAATWLLYACRQVQFNPTTFPRTRSIHGI